MCQILVTPDCPGLDHNFIWLGPASPTPPSLSSLPRSSCLHLHENSSSLGINVTIPGHLSHQAPSTFEGTPSVNLDLMKVMSTRIFVILIGYCHIGSQRGRVLMQVRAG